MIAILGKVGIRQKWPKSHCFSVFNPISTLCSLNLFQNFIPRLESTLFFIHTTNPHIKGDSNLEESGS